MSISAGANFALIMTRDLTSLENEVSAYPDDASVWKIGGEVKNSAGTLVTHLVGNLEHYVGAVLGGSGYVRDRDREFSERDVPRSELAARVAACRDRVRATLEGISDEAMAAPFPGELPPAAQGASTHLFLLHLSGHLMWHLGQVNYHRRLLA